MKSGIGRKKNYAFHPLRRTDDVDWTLTFFPLTFPSKSRRKARLFLWSLSALEVSLLDYAAVSQNMWCFFGVTILQGKLMCTKWYIPPFQFGFLRYFVDQALYYRLAAFQIKFSWLLWLADVRCRIERVGISCRIKDLNNIPYFAGLLGSYCLKEICVRIE